MKINVLGGGPAGLYFSLLMVHRDPSHRITVFERDAADDTFGWGGSRPTSASSRCSSPTST